MAVRCKDCGRVRRLVTTATFVCRYCLSLNGTRVRKTLGWRREASSGYHFFGDDKYDYGYVHRTPDGGEWYATVYGKLLERAPRLKDAKRLVEREVRNRYRSPKRHPRGR